MKKYPRPITVITALALLLLPVSYNACSNTRFETEGSSTQTGSGAGNPMVPLHFAPFSPQRVHIGCLIAIEFYETIGGPGQLFMLPPRPVEINFAGTDLGQFDIPSGTFRQIALGFGPGCSSVLPDTNTSFVVNNNSGMFSTNMTFDMRFDGLVTAPIPLNPPLVFDVSPIIQQLESVAADNQIEPRATQVTGGY